MQIHQLKIENKLKKKKRIGRGGKRGTYSGRGIKGQKSRAGRKMEPIIRGSIKRYPKLRGYKFKSFKDTAVLNLSELNFKFNEGQVITPQLLVSKKIVRRISGRTPKVKILSMGKIDKKIIIENCQVSISAKEKIEKAGGMVKPLKKEENKKKGRKGNKVKKEKIELPKDSKKEKENKEKNGKKDKKEKKVKKEEKEKKIKKESPKDSKK